MYGGGNETHLAIALDTESAPFKRVRREGCEDVCHVSRNVFAGGEGDGDVSVATYLDRSVFDV